MRASEAERTRALDLAAVRVGAQASTSVLTRFLELIAECELDLAVFAGLCRRTDARLLAIGGHASGTLGAHVLLASSGLLAARLA